MIKPINIASLVLIILSALGLFQIKYYVQNLSKDHTQLVKYVEQEKEAIHVLKAEWTYLNQPDRLKRIIANHLPLEIINVNQIHKMYNNLPVKLVEKEIDENPVIRKEKEDNFAKIIMKPISNKVKLIKDKTLIDKKVKPKLSKVKF